MDDGREGEVTIASEGDILTARRTVRDVAARLDFGITDVTRIVTAASELARNVFAYAGSGVMRWRVLESNDKVGIGLTFEDYGPGIADVDKAVGEGFSTSGGLGMGLPGSKRLMDDFQITSELGKGTCVAVNKWKCS